MRNLFAILFSSLCFVSNAQVPITLSEAIGKLLEKNPALKKAGLEAQIATNNNTAGNAGMLPTVSLNYAGTTSSSNVKQEANNPAVQLKSIKGARSTTQNFNLLASWTIFDGKAMFFNKARLEDLEKAGKELLRAQTDNLIAQLSTTYFNAVQLQQRQVVLKSNLAISEERVSLEKTRFEAGTGSKLAWLNAQVDKNADLAALMQSELQYKNACFELERLIGEQPTAKYIPSDSLYLDPSFSISKLKETLMKQSPILLQNRLVSEAAYNAWKAQFGARFPRVSITASASDVLSYSQAGVLKRSDNLGFNAGITGSWNLYNGLNNHRLEQNAQLGYEIANTDITAAEQQANYSFAVAEAAYNAWKQLLDVERSNIEVARTNTRIAQDRLKLGVATPLEFRETQRNLLAAENRLIEARLQCKESEIEIRRLCSQLLPYQP